MDLQEEGCYGDKAKNTTMTSNTTPLTAMGRRITTTKNHTTTTLNTTTRARHGHHPKYHGQTQAQLTKIIDTALSSLCIS